MKSAVYRTELGISGILSESWRLFKENFWLIAIIIFVVYVPVNIILYLVPADSMIDQGLRGIRMYVRIIQILEGLIGIIATMAIAYLIKVRLDNKKISSWTALKEAVFKWPAAFLTSFVTGISLLFLFLLLIVPGIIFAVYWMFVLYVVILKDETAFDAMSYSKSLVKGRWWKTLGYSIVFGLLGLIVSLFLGFILGGIAYFLPANIFGAGIDVILTTFTDVITAFFSVVFVVFFLNFDATKKK